MTAVSDIAVVGGGAAGMMAALTAARAGASVTLIERNPKLGRKVYITGKGRCNLTNHCPPGEVLRNVPRNGKFLHSAMSSFPPEAAERFFEDLGVPLKVERGNRVFPRSDRAADVIDAFFFALGRAGVKTVRDRALSLSGDGRVESVAGEEGRYGCGAAILATGGMSYPLTGSTGDGYAMAAAAGHTVVPPRGSLVPLESDDPCCAQMQGLSLKNVALRLLDGKGGKTLYREQGELLFTHFGLSGPLVLSASAHLPETWRDGLCLSIDLKPALDEKELDTRLLRDLEGKSNASFSTLLAGLLPASMVPVMAGRVGVSPGRKAHTVRREERRALLRALKEFVIPLSGVRPVEEAIVTAGGVKTGEVNPKTMASKMLPGLFFAGELLDVDGYTGGFNLQIAWATGRAAGLGAAAYLEGSFG